MTPEFFLILPNIRSCHNVGAMFRTADACGVTKIYLVGYTPQPPRKEIDKVALGAEKAVPWEARKRLKPLLTNLKKEGVTIVALEMSEESVSLTDVAFAAPVALIVGNEVDGITADILALADKIVHIPMRGVKESLNVSIAAGIGMFAISQQIRQ